MMSRRFHLIAYAGLMLGLAWPAASWAQTASKPLRFGVLPNISARILLTHYQPMREYLSEQLKREVVIETSTNFKTFAQSTSRGEYDLIVTAPNLGLMAKVDQGWKPLASYEPKIPALLVALKQNPNDDVKQLQGKKLALSNPQSLVALVGLKWLSEQGLTQDKDYKVTLAANDESLGVLLNGGEAPMAMMSMGEYKAKSEAMRATLRIVKVMKELPGFMVMSNPKMPAQESAQLQAAMRAFPQTTLGKRYFELTGFKNIGPVDEDGMAFLSSFVDQTRAGLDLK